MNEQQSAGVRPALEIIVGLLLLLAGLTLVGLLDSWARFTAAGLPSEAVTAAMGYGQLLAAGVHTAVLTLFALAGLSALAYLMATFRWDVNGQDWHDIVKHGAVQAARNPNRPAMLAARKQDRAERHKQRNPLRRDRPRPPTRPAPGGDAVVRTIAGFNLIVIDALVALAVASFVEDILPSAWWSLLGAEAFLIVWVVAFLVGHQVMTRLDVLRFPRFHALIWVVVAVGAVFCSAPIGVLILIGVGISTFGRRVADRPPPSTPGELLRHPLPWSMLGIVALVGLAYQAMPPVSFPRASVITANGRLLGGYLGRSPAGVYVVTCTALANATSVAERVRFVPSGQLQTLAVGGPPMNLDTGDRPSLATLAMRAIGVDGQTSTWLNVDLRARRGTCAGADPPSLTAASEDPSLGSGVIVGSAPVGGIANDGEKPVAQTTKPPLAQLALRYQPTLLVSAADRFWPVSVDAVIDEVSPGGTRTCLHQATVTTVICAPQLTAATLAHTDNNWDDYLQFPIHIRHDPFGVGQFRSFMRGQGIDPGRPRDWLADPGLLYPFRSAEIYFLWGPTVPLSAFPVPAPPGASPTDTVVPLEYWFYYPYNYVPLLSTASLMGDAPFAADRLNVDLHQGDWEHIDVLLNSATLAPEWLYMARHSGEGEFLPWSSPTVARVGDHPIVQAAYGGHPTYEPGCGVRIRNQAGDVLVDWLVCGGGRFAFRATTTPLIDIAQQPWACWKGHFGEASTAQQRHNASAVPEFVREIETSNVFVAGPSSPVRQAENTGACTTGPRQIEQSALSTYFP